MFIVPATMEDQEYIDNVENEETTEQDFFVILAGHRIILRLISPLDHATSEVLFDQVADMFADIFGEVVVK